VGLLGLAGCPLRTLDRRVAAVAGVLTGELIVGGRRDISLAIAGALGDAALNALEDLVGGAPCPPLFEVVSGLSTERLVGIADLVAAAVVLDELCGIAPGTPAPDALRERAERLGEVAKCFLTVVAR
jgi:hypothetical protein